MRPRRLALVSAALCAALLVVAAAPQLAHAAESDSKSSGFWGGSMFRNGGTPEVGPPAGPLFRYNAGPGGGGGGPGSDGAGVAGKPVSWMLPIAPAGFGGPGVVNPDYEPSPAESLAAMSGAHPSAAEAQQVAGAYGGNIIRPSLLESSARDREADPSAAANGTAAAPDQQAHNGTQSVIKFFIDKRERSDEGDKHDVIMIRKEKDSSNAAGSRTVSVHGKFNSSLPGGNSTATELDSNGNSTSLQQVLASGNTEAKVIRRMLPVIEMADDMLNSLEKRQLEGEATERVRNQLQDNLLRQMNAADERSIDELQRNNGFRVELAPGRVVDVRPDGDSDGNGDGDSDGDGDGDGNGNGNNEGEIEVDVEPVVMQRPPVPLGMPVQEEAFGPLPFNFGYRAPAPLLPPSLMQALALASEGVAPPTMIPASPFAGFMPPMAAPQVSAVPLVENGRVVGFVERVVEPQPMPMQLPFGFGPQPQLQPQQWGAWPLAAQEALPVAMGPTGAAALPLELEITPESDGEVPADEAIVAPLLRELLMDARAAAIRSRGSHTPSERRDAEIRDALEQAVASGDEFRPAILQPSQDSDDDGDDDSAGGNNNNNNNNNNGNSNTIAEDDDNGDHVDDNSDDNSNDNNNGENSDDDDNDNDGDLANASADDKDTIIAERALHRAEEAAEDAVDNLNEAFQHLVSHIKNNSTGNQTAGLVVRYPAAPLLPARADGDESQQGPEEEPALELRGQGEGEGETVSQGSDSEEEDKETAAALGLDATNLPALQPNTNTNSNVNATAAVAPEAGATGANRTALEEWMRVVNYTHHLHEASA